MKKLIALMLVFVMLLSMAAVAAADEPVRVYALKGPTGIGMVKMMNDNDGSYAFTLAGAGDEIVAAVASGSCDIAAVPTNLSATLYNKTQGGVKLIALNTLGVLHILTTDESIDSIDDLKGKTLYATGQGSTPEYVLNYILSASGVADEVTVEYKAEHAELATLAAAGSVELVMLPEPHVTSVLNQNQAFRMALDVTEQFNEYSKLNGENATLSMGCVIVRSEFAEQHPDKVADFMAEYQASVNFVNENVAEAAQMVQEQGVMPKAAVAQKAIPNCHIVYIDGEAMKAQIEPFFQILFNANPKSVGGKMPAEDFYYIVK